MPTSEATTEHPPHLLVVDDDDVDREAILRNLRRNKLTNEVSVAVDGKAALELLRGTTVDNPRVVILDWKMPGMDGQECLRQIRADPKLADTVVFVVTSSDDPIDVRTAYGHNVAGFLVKSRGLAGLSDLIRAYNHYIELPH